MILIYVILINSASAINIFFIKKRNNSTTALCTCTTFTVRLLIKVCKTHRAAQYYQEEIILFIVLAQREQFPADTAAALRLHRVNSRH